jgi:2-keto-4-pentenoate hydratase/2-oxohepta-3-ene-1,7-dioic acid hydratase in catechol pathway
MKIVVFADENRVGVRDADRVIDVNEAYGALSDGNAAEADAQCPAGLAAFIEAGEQALAAASAAVSYALEAGPDARGPRGRPISVTDSDAKLGAPWAGRRIAAIGGNYPDHLARMGAGRPDVDDAAIKAAHETQRAATPWGFWKITDQVAGPGEAIAVPRRADYFDFEGEVAVVIGRRGKDISAQEAGRYIWGVTLVNDWSIRGNLGPPRVMSFNLAKNFDGCVSMGPCIAVGVRHPLDPGAIDVAVSVNGAERQRFSTRTMIWSFAEVIELLSRDLTLLPGDVICGGTAAGTAADSTPRGPGGTFADSKLFTKPGDTVEITSPQIGTLVCRVAGTPG